MPKGKGTEHDLSDTYLDNSKFIEMPERLIVKDNTNCSQWHFHELLAVTQI